MSIEDSYARNLRAQLAMNAETWQTLLRNGLKPDTELQLDFLFRSPDEKRAEGLKELLEEYDYEVEVSEGETSSEGEWLVSGKTIPTALSLEKLDQWVEWMVAAGKEYDSEFDGWGTSV
jgi:regulator of RNase E activity RraB